MSVTFVDKLEEANKHKYDETTVRWIQIIYIGALLVWVLFVVFFDLLQSDWIIILLLFIPVVVFVINFISLGEFMGHLEAEMFRGNFLYFGFIVAIILINWESPVETQDKTNFFRLVITAFILLMLSIVDLWVGKGTMSLVKHFKTCLHTISLSLLAVALYLYYTYHRDSYDVNDIAASGKMVKPFTK